MYTNTDYNIHGAIPLLFISPCWFPDSLLLPFLIHFTYLETLLGVTGSVHPGLRLLVNWSPLSQPSPNPSPSKFPEPRLLAPHYDDLKNPASSVRNSYSKQIGFHFIKLLLLSEALWKLRYICSYCCYQYCHLHLWMLQPGTLHRQFYFCPGWCIHRWRCCWWRPAPFCWPGSLLSGWRSQQGGSYGAPPATPPDQLPGVPASKSATITGFSSLYKGA